VIIRCGLPESTGTLPRAAASAGLPALISAGRLWVKGRFRQPGLAVWDLPSVAIDSAGFVAMQHHKGYPWTVAQYVEMVATHRPGMPWPWAWWSQMDLCCEPQIARDRAAVLERVTGTVALLGECNREADQWGIMRPMPILQGWRPSDYLLCADGEEAELGEWPALVGIGSVCRRNLDGPDGLFAILDTVERRLPAHVGLHLFGVKGDALPELSRRPRVVSVDSCAWDMAEVHATRALRRGLVEAEGCTMEEATKRIPADIRRRRDTMLAWMQRAEQQARGPAPVRQMRLW